MVCYREALADDPSQEAAKARLEYLRMVLKRKVSACLNAVSVPSDFQLSALEMCLFSFPTHTHILCKSGPLTLLMCLYYGPSMSFPLHTSSPCACFSSLILTPMALLITLL